MSVSCRQPQISALLTRKYGTVILIIIQLYSGVLYDRRTCCKHRWKDLLSCVSPAVPCLVLLTHTSKRDRRRAAPVAVLAWVVSVWVGWRATKTRVWRRLCWCLALGSVPNTCSHFTYLRPPTYVVVWIPNVGC